MTYIEPVLFLSDINGKIYFLNTDIKQIQEGNNFKCLPHNNIWWYLGEYIQNQMQSWDEIPQIHVGAEEQLSE